MKETKKMNYAIEPLRKILHTEAISDGGTEKKAAALEGTWIKINESMVALVEESQTTLVFNDGTKTGCACGRFRDPENLLCEHIIAFGNLPNPPQQTIDSEACRGLQEYLFSRGWYSENRMLYPSLDSPTAGPITVAELPPHRGGAKLDPVNADKALDIGVGDKPETRKYSRKCPHCGVLISGTDLPKVKLEVAEHTQGCSKNPENKKAKPPSKKEGSLFDWIEELVEFGVGQIFGDTGTAKTAFCRELAEQAAEEGKRVVYWDSEGNMTRKQRAAMTEHKNITYILDRDWDHIKNMLSSDLSKGSPKLGKCDIFILDSIGVPVLGIYGTLKQNEKGNALQAMQGLLYQLTKFAEKNDAVVLVTNQPVSEMNKTELESADRRPFGDKAMFFTKEILKIVPGERTEYKTVCHILAWRSRSAGRGKMLCTVAVSDKGVEVTPTGGV